MFYISRATREMARGELEDLLLGARTRNAARNITGMLLYDSGHFAQVVEGPREAVEALFGSISRDPRHAEVLVVSRAAAAERDFLGWTMRYANLEERKEPDLDRIKNLMRSHQVSDPAVAYRYLLAFQQSLES